MQSTTHINELTDSSLHRIFCLHSPRLSVCSHLCLETRHRDQERLPRFRYVLHDGSTLNAYPGNHTYAEEWSPAEE
jgi:hypothetical protein